MKTRVTGLKLEMDDGHGVIGTVQVESGPDGGLLYKVEERKYRIANGSEPAALLETPKKKLLALPKPDRKTGMKRDVTKNGQMLHLIETCVSKHGPIGIGDIRDKLGLTYMQVFSRCKTLVRRKLFVYDAEKGVYTHV